MHLPVASCALIVFLRLPEWGKVKKRLANTLGNDETLRIYKELTAITLNTLSLVEVPSFLFYEGGLPPNKDRLASLSYHAQSEGHLGEKMLSAISFVLQFHSKVVVIGSDCPTLSPEIIHESFVMLDNCDVVIGPATDGGYYLIGCKKYLPSLFTDITWGSTTVMEQTIRKIKEEQLNYELLQPLTDIDNETDWIYFKSTLSTDQ